MHPDFFKENLQLEISEKNTGVSFLVTIASLLQYSWTLSSDYMSDVFLNYQQNVINSLHNKWGDSSAKRNILAIL